ncbi:hypothetical protein Halru_0410 [Halovivax ruber XH-70]|uniref:Uncharacterized protein n=1 Tax=Halovivax ruber (strain DSM 18193 / JCM 13892 / XH-70) TaxID=797302 RepID=L0I8B9_HALRX|nr:hypothetical protein [Halovivax ruber]AGB15053.1 hypothetical protein Halru_0410 [Halovivax ruber XH-70]
MMWQDFVFMIGSSLSIGFLAPTLRDANARVPLGTSVPSMTIGIVYGITFTTLGMPFSALGAFVTGTMWSLVAIVRSPLPDTPKTTRRERLRALGRDVVRSVEPLVDAVPVLRATGSEGHNPEETGQPAD